MLNVNIFHLFHLLFSFNGYNKIGFSETLKVNHEQLSQNEIKPNFYKQLNNNA